MAANTVHRIKDTDGWAWHVHPGDPAHPLCELISSLGYAPRLPAAAIITGIVTPTQVDEAFVQVESLAALAEEMGDIAATAEALLDATEYYDQLRTIRAAGSPLYAGSPEPVGGMVPAASTPGQGAGPAYPVEFSQRLAPLAISSGGGPVPAAP